MAQPAHHPSFYASRYPRREDLETLIWAWENLPSVRREFHAPAYGDWGGWGMFSKAAAGQTGVDRQRVELAQRLLVEGSVWLELGGRRVHFTRPRLA